MINALLLGLEKYIKIFIQDFIFDINNIFIHFTDVHESLYCICKAVKWKFLLLYHHELHQDSEFPQCPTLVYCCESGTANWFNCLLFVLEFCIQLTIVTPTLPKWEF